jgi:hypothetical protein
MCPGHPWLILRFPDMPLHVTDLAASLSLHHTTSPACQTLTGRKVLITSDTAQLVSAHVCVSRVRDVCGPKPVLKTRPLIAHTPLGLVLDSV